MSKAIKDIIDDCFSTLEKAITAHGLAALSKESGIPYAILYGYRRRGWHTKALDTLLTAIEAADRLNNY